MIPAEIFVKNGNKFLAYISVYDRTTNTNHNLGSIDMFYDLSSTVGSLKRSCLATRLSKDKCNTNLLLGNRFFLQC